MTISTTPITPHLEEILERALHTPSESLQNIFDSGDFFGKKAMQISWLQASFLQMIVNITNSHNIFEIGTYVGFSSAVMATSSSSFKSVTTCEINEDYYNFAKSNFEKHGLSKNIKIILGDAKDITLKLIKEKKKFDIFFLDGDKENYSHYLEMALEILPVGGLFIVDNILFKGELASASSVHAIGIKKLFDKMHSHPSFDISYVTIGDGMLIARRRDI